MGYASDCSNLRHLFFTVTCASIVILLITAIVTTHFPNSAINACPELIIHQGRGSLEQNLSKEIIILGWTKRTTSASWRSEGPLVCGDARCIYSEDQALYNKSEAILVRPNRLVEEKTSLAPPYRFLWQKWIAIELEPPPLVWFQHKKGNINFVSQKGFYNVTAMPVRDADVPWFNRPRHWVIDETKYASLQNVSFVGNKTKLVAWFVSHCKTASDRETYVKQLQKYIQVDVYGKCGPFTCNLQDASKNGKKGNKWSERCDNEVLHAHYKFYISFENSLCEDYLTEKLTRIYSRQTDIIPIVLGHVNYSKLLPEGSYIDVRDFKSEKELADYLHHVDKNTTLFNEYVRRKRSSVAVKVADYFCNLCQHLHQHRNDIQIVDNVVDFYSLNRRCLTPRTFFKNHSADNSLYRDYFHTRWG